MNNGSHHIYIYKYIQHYNNNLTSCNFYVHISHKNHHFKIKRSNARNLEEKNYIFSQVRYKLQGQWLNFSISITTHCAENCDSQSFFLPFSFPLPFIS